MATSLLTLELIGVVFVLLAAIVGYVFRGRLYSIKQEIAPWGDRFDAAFAFVVIAILLGGYATFVDSVSRVGLWVATQEFIKQSGLIALLTGFTAIIALYRLRHRPDKSRPAVREDFDNYHGNEPTDFGLRNFGPGPVLYLQAAVEVVDANADDDDHEFNRQLIEVHDNPIHLQEGEFASLVQKRDCPWVREAAEEFGIQDPEESEGRDTSPMVHLHYTYVSQTGAREPTAVTAERDDTRLLESNDLTDRNDDPRKIELEKVWEAENTDRTENVEQNSGGRV